MVHPQEVPVEFLYFICYSFSIHENWLDWSHSYGGLVSQKPMDHYPWEQLRIYGLITRVLGMSKLSPLHTSTQNPYWIPEIQEALENKHVEAVEGEGTASHVFREHEDCFSRLPMELCEEILMPLPSKDVANLRMASRSFARITLSQAFWKSRFKSGFEREHIFEVSESKHPEYVSSHRDWRVLYHKTSLSVLPSRGLANRPKTWTNPSVLPSRGLANRRRIWTSCRPLVDILKSRPLDMTESTGLEDASEWSWRGVGGEAALDMPHHFFPSTSCKVLKERAVPLPSEITEILASTVTFYDKVYITGLRIVGQDQSDTVLGYISGEEASLDLRSEDGKPGILTGFIAAVDASGIRGLKATLLDGRISEWAGQGDEIPVTLRLCTDKLVTHLKGGFDVSLVVSQLCSRLTSPQGFKMVWLSIPSEHTHEETSPHVPLRTTALWYPDVPPKEHYLHDSSFAGRALPLTQHRPLIRVMFGGPNGSYLKYLTKISVTVSRGFVAGLEFEYEAPGSPIGRMRACRSTTSADDSVKIPFAIDGPGGEILTGMQVKGDFWPSSSPSSQNGAVIALAVC